MKSMSIHELDNEPGVLERAVAEEAVVLASAGKPFAMVVGLLHGENPAELVRIIRQARALWALSAARAAARLNGTDKLTMEEIDAEIRAARAERAARAQR